jgi:hypothetical protein
MPSDQPKEEEIPLADVVDGKVMKSEEAAHGHGQSNGTANGALPSPVSAPNSTQKAAKITGKAAAIIPIWMTFSIGVIIYNKYILTTLDFRYPIMLVTWHLLFAASGLFLQTLL